MPFGARNVTKQNKTKHLKQLDTRGKRGNFGELGKYIPTKSIQIQVFKLQLYGQAKHSYWLASLPICHPAFLSAQNPLLPSCFNLPLILNLSPLQPLVVPRTKLWRPS